MKAPRIAALVAVALSLAGRPAQAQVRGFGDLGITTFSAAQSFDAVLGTSTGLVFGGGAEVLLPHDLFVGLRASLFRHDGHRVFVFEGERFELDVPTTVSVTPVVVTGGYRFTTLRRGVIPYVGAGVGWHRLREVTETAADSETVTDTYTGFHLLGGAEFRLSALLAVAGEAEWATVPDALGNDSSSVATVFDESDLGGFTFRVKFILGR